MVPGLLVVVSCCGPKKWDTDPGLGAIPAKDAYTSPPFKARRRYAETFSERWVILSAKHGFLDPDDLVPGPYDLVFGANGAIDCETLHQQVSEKMLARFPRVAVLGSFDYWVQVVSAFVGSQSVLAHVDRGKGFPPVLSSFLNGLMARGTWENSG